MSKMRVQDATKELSASANRLYESVSRSLKRVQDTLVTLKKLEDNAKQKEREKQQAQEAAKQKEAAASFMTAYTSEQVAGQAVPASASEHAQIPPTQSAPTEKQAGAEPEAMKTSQAETVPAKAEEEKEVIKKETALEKTVQAEAETVQASEPTEAPKAARPARESTAPQKAAQKPAQQGKARPQGPYGRPVNPQGAPQQQGARPQGPYGRPVNPQGAPQQQGARPQGPYGRPVNPQGAPQQQGARPQGPYGRPVNPQGAPQQGAMNQRGGQRPQGGMNRAPQSGSSGRAGGGGFGRKLSSELAPAMEKERVSNYDPNKKNYIRQNDPERVAKNRKQLARENTRNRGGLDDEFERGKRGKRKQQQPQFHPEPVKIEKAYMTAENITVKDLSERIGKPSGEIIKKLLLLGIMATINAELDFDTAQLVSSEFDVELELKLDKTAEDVLSDENFEDKEEDLVLRNPVVTIMGHVDHGKTSLLDYIRKTRVTASEAGGITQHIGAYTVNVGDKGITFLDTPGHEAFTAMRARGAMATDIAVLVVAADDGVMPQTVESINHAKAANVPIIVAINKCDKPTANPERIRTELTEYNLVAEEWGGDTIMVEVSAVTGQNIDQLLEMILLVTEVQNLRANPNRKARGIIIEAKLDKSRGPVATVLVQNGTLKVGDTIVAGTAYGRVRAMVNDRGERVREAGPSMPVEVIGFGDVPAAGDVISAVDDDKLSRQVAEERRDKLRAALVKSQTKTTLDDLFNQISAGQVKDLNLIIKADVQGSVEAVRQSLEKLSNDEVRVRAIHGAVGAITESDVMLASASNAIIIGFNVRYDSNVRDLAAREKVDIRLYRVIYDAIEEVQAAMKGLLAPKYRENTLGRAEVRQTYKVSGVGTVAGCYVQEGKIQRNAQVRLLRDNVVITESKIDSLRRFKDDAREVAAGYECGVGLENYNDIKEGDILECFLMEEIQQ